MKKQTDTCLFTEVNYKVKGFITNHNHQPYAYGLVRIFMKDIWGMLLIAETSTDISGGYNIDYKPNFKTPYAIMVSVYDNDSVLIRESHFYYEVPEVLRVDLEVGGLLPGMSSELENLLESIAPFELHLPLFELTETLRKPDISFVAKWIKWPYGNVEKLAMAARFASHSSISIGVWYALLKYIPENYNCNSWPLPRYCNTYEERLVLLLDSLMHTPVNVLMDYLGKAIEERIIDSTHAPSFGKIQKQLIVRIISHSKVHSVMGNHSEIHRIATLGGFYGKEAGILN